MPITKYEILQKRLKGASPQQLSLDLDMPADIIDKCIKEAITEIRDTTTLTLQDSKAIELARLDKWSEIIESKLKSDCNDIEDEESGRLLRDGVRAANSCVTTLLNISKQRVAIMKLDGIEDDVKTEAAIMFEQIKNMDMSEVADISDLIDITKTLHEI